MHLRFSAQLLVPNYRSLVISVLGQLGLYVANFILVTFLIILSAH